MKKLNQNGIAHLGVVGVVLILTIAGLVGWRVWQVRQDNRPVPPSNDSTQTTQKKTPTNTSEKKTTPSIPEGYVKYENKELGFSFAYPKEYGSFTSLKADGGLSGVLSTTIPDPAYSTGINQAIVIKTADSNYGFGTYKYGPKIKLNDGKLIVTEINPADQYNKPGLEFRDSLGKEPKSQDNDGLKVFLIHGGDEATLTNVIIFATNNKVSMIQLPNFSDDYLFTNSGTPINQAKYNSLVQNIFSSVRAL